METIDRIKEAALYEFIVSGYEGASLAIIAENVGIKKQSIYTHYKSKQDLFFQVTNQVIQDEISFINQFFVNNNSKLAKDLLYDFILSIKKRMMNEKDLNINFMLRMAFMPPSLFKEDLVKEFNGYFVRLEQLIINVFGNENTLVISKKEATIAFLTIFEGLLVELIYGNEVMFNNKLSITWEIYWNGMSC